MTKSPTQSLKYTRKNAKTIIVRIVWFKHILLSNIYNGIEHKFYNLYTVLSSILHA